jgi:YD repeat-containing protein
MKPNSDESYNYTEGQTVSVETDMMGKWILLEGEVEIPSNIKRVAIRVDNNGVGTVWFDEIRFYPSDALMTTYTYKPLVGMTSQTDSNGVTTYYIYDSLGRLESIKDNNHKVLKNIKYNYKHFYY